MDKTEREIIAEILWELSLAIEEGCIDLRHIRQMIKNYQKKYAK